MYTEVSDAYKSKIAEASRTFRVKLAFANGSEVTEGVISATAEGQTNSDKETLSLGGTVSWTVTVEMTNDSEVTISGEFTLSIGLLLDDGTVEYVPMGVYTPQKPVYAQDGSTVSFTAYDRMVSRFEQSYSTDITSYPADGKDILAEISEQTGVPLGNVDDLPDSVMVKTRTVQYGDSGQQVVAPFYGCTYRLAIAYLAQLYGTYATMNRSGELEFRWYQDADFTLDGDRIFDGSFSDAYTLGRIECETGSETLTVGDGSTGISISNPLMTIKRLESIWEQITPMAYRPYEGSFLGDPRVDLGDKVTVLDNTIPVMSINQDYDGGLTTDIGSFGKTEEEESNPSGPTEQALEKLQEELANVNGLTVYEYNNEDAVALDDTEKRIILIRYTATAETKAEFKSTILLNVTTDSTALLTLTYRINSEKIVTHIPTATLGSGNHIITLFYQINGIEANTTNRFEVLAQIENGTADIAIGGILATITGNGFAAEASWDGYLEIEETIATVSLQEAELSVAEMQTDVSTVTQQPAGDSLTETLAVITLSPEPLSVAAMQDEAGAELTDA